MKSEERHRRQENELVHYLEIAADKARPHTNKIFGLVGLVIGAMLLTSFWSQRQASKNREAWDRYQMALTDADVEYTDVSKIADTDELQGTAVQEWAYLAYADRQLRQASDFFLVDRESSLDRLEGVSGVYKELAAGASSQELRDRAQLGLARVLEVQNKLDEARAEYSRIKGPLAAYAAERIQQLDSVGAAEACDWLASAELPSISLPNGLGTPGDRPNFDVQSPATDPLSTGPVSPLDPEMLRSLDDVLGGAGGDAGRYEETPAADATTDANVGTDGDLIEIDVDELVGDNSTGADADADSSDELGDDAARNVETPAEPE